MNNCFTKPSHFIYSIINRFFQNDGTYRAAALSFTNLLAIVPLMSVSFTILTYFPRFNEMFKMAENFVFQNFVPETSKVVQTYLQNFTHQASELSIWGILFLIVSAVLMLFTIESALNNIWHVKKRRHHILAFFLYWGFLSFAPLLLALTLILSAYFISFPLVAKLLFNLGFLKPYIIAGSTFIVSLLVLTFVYIIVPNCKVAFWHGFTGAIVAAAGIHLAKIGFSLYLQSFRTYELIYGAFAAIPIFFLWVYLVWVVVLLGAEVAYAME